MPTATPERRPGWVKGLPVLAVLVAAIVAVGPWRDGPERTSPSPTSATPPDAVEVTSDAPRFATVTQLVAASDVVVQAEVVATERGRWFGDGNGGARIQSRFVTLRLDEVLAGTAPRSSTVLVEEEGWLADGLPLVVDGAPPSRTGDAGVWFLVDGADPEVGAYVVVNAQGRFLATGGGTLVGPSGPDPLVDEVEAGSTQDLAIAVSGA